MHELSIADSVVQIASRHAQGRRVERVELKIGHLRQVVPSALEFAFELLAAGTCVEGAELIVDQVPAAGRCRSCAAEATMSAFPLQCPVCGSLDLELLAGEELLVEALELADAGEAQALSGSREARLRAGPGAPEEQLITSN
ncbi:MAG TPA: hydrogenase maturation nickel metallochaperone HypA [Solirubrobacteraceae bacterium]|jgi:hydrogenase nickel incorporation protein HypA/HybF|nr:hydrogenase maturation nickel metallochaperone HypA [Solirubrobacteraceae bacterium]